MEVDIFVISAIGAQYGVTIVCRIDCRLDGWLIGGDVDGSRRLYRYHAAGPCDGILSAISHEGLRCPEASDFTRLISDRDKIAARVEGRDSYVARRIRSSVGSSLKTQRWNAKQQQQEKNPAPQGAYSPHTDLQPYSLSF